MKTLTGSDKRVSFLFRMYGKKTQQWQMRCAQALLEVKEKNIWRKLGCKSIYEYAHRFAGMDEDQVEEVLSHKIVTG